MAHCPNSNLSSLYFLVCFHLTIISTLDRKQPSQSMTPSKVQFILYRLDIPTEIPLPSRPN